MILRPLVLSRHRAWHSSAAVIVLALLCGVLGILEYHSTEEIGAAERTRFMGLCVPGWTPSAGPSTRRYRAPVPPWHRTRRGLKPRDRRQRTPSNTLACKARYSQLFRRVALAVPKEGKLQLLILDPARRSIPTRPPPAGWTRDAGRSDSEALGDQSRLQPA